MDFYFSCSFSKIETLILTFYGFDIRNPQRKQGNDVENSDGTKGCEKWEKIEREKERKH